MIIVEVYRKAETDIIATLSYSGRGNKVTITTDDSETKASMETLVSSMLQARHQRIVSPDDRQEWIEALPEALTTIPYWYKIADAIDEIIEEVEDGDEIEEEADDEGDDTADGGGEGDSSDGGDDDPDDGTEDDRDGEFFNTNG